MQTFLITRIGGHSKQLHISSSLREPGLEFAETQPSGAVVKQLLLRELSTHRVVGSLLPSPVLHESFPAVLGWDCALLCIALPSAFLFSSGLGGLLASNPLHWQ